MADPALERLVRVIAFRAELYGRALAGDTLLPNDQPVRATIVALHEQATAQVEAVRTLGVTIPLPDAERYDFGGNMGQGGGAFANSLTTLAEFLKLSQLSEDLLVRCALAAFVAASPDAQEDIARLLGAAARGAAAIRRLRAVTTLNPKPWITGVSAGTGFTSTTPVGAIRSQTATAALVYGAASTGSGASTAEDNLVQGRLAFASASASTEAFDEPIPLVSIDLFLAQFSQ